MIATRSAELLPPPEWLAEVLSEDQPFGDSAYIHAELHTALQRRLSRISRLLPAAGDLAETLAATDPGDRARICGDPVLRGVTQQALAQVVSGSYRGLPLSDCAEVLRAIDHAVAASDPIGPLGAEGAIAGRLGPKSFHGWIWTEERADGPLSSAFRYLVARNFDGPLAAPDDRDVGVLQRSAALVEEVCPPLAASVLSHARLIAVFPQTGRWQQVSSCSQFRVGGVVFLARERLGDPRYVAEHLLHEALHQKLYDLRHAHSILRRDFDTDLETETENPAVVSVWNTDGAAGSNRWGPSRTLAAFHVYTHLAVYARLAEAAYGPPGSEELTTSTSAFRRAVYLGEQLRRHYAAELGVAGDGLAQWLTQCLELTAPMLSPSQLRASLFLERYLREATAMGALTRQPETPAATSAALSRLAVSELGSARRILDHHGGPRRRNALDGHVAAGSPTDAAAVRRAVHTALAEIVEAETRSGAHALVEELVEQSSRQVATLLGATEAGEPAAAASAAFDERAELLRLTDIIGEVFGTEDFGLFLYSIVRMHVPRTIVELGTGLGTSAFWMALAAKRNGIGRIWTVDDLSLSEAAARLVDEHRHRLVGTIWEALPAVTTVDCLAQIRRILGLDSQLTFVHRRLDPDDPHHFDTYPFGDPIDLVFSDFSHGPEAVVGILGQLLPRMAGASSIFIDGASTAWSSYLLLEHLVHQLNAGTIPALLQSRSPVDLAPVMANRRVVLVHLTERKDRLQNSTAWLKLEPVDLRPHPLTAVRGLG